MNITLCGVRGSIPTTSPDTREHGGNTSCVSIEADGCLIVLDAGSGIQNVKLPPSIKARRVDILLTHLHIDHIQGIGFFKPLFDPTMDIHIWGPAGSTHSLRSRLGRYLSPPFFPVYFRDLPCHLTLHEIGNSHFDIGPFHILSRFIIHPGPTVGFRIEHASGTFTYLPDHEPALGVTGLSSNPLWLSGSELSDQTDLLLHDAQYTALEYPHKQGWGHSSMEDAIAFARLTGAKHLLLSHHDPTRTDQELHALDRFLKRKIATSFPYKFSREGMEIRIER